MAGLGYRRARQLLLVTGLLVLVGVALLTYARRVDTVEVVATLLFLPVLVGFVLRGVLGGVTTALVAIAVYAAMRSPAIDAVGIGEFTGLLTSRAAAYLIFGAVGGWSTQVLEGSLEKLELYDEIDDATGLFNARHLLHQTELEMARAKRYQTLFSTVTLDVPAAGLHGLTGRARRVALRDLGRLLGEGVRTVDHVVHVLDGGTHRLVAILPETGAEGAEVFRSRFQEQVSGFLAGRGATVAAESLTSAALTFPGDDDALDGLRADTARLDAEQHR